MSNSHPVPDGLTPDLDPAFERIPGSAGYGSAFGPTFHMLAADHCLVAFKVGPEHLNHRGVCHGGALLTFADIALSCPARMGQRSNQTFETTAHLSLDFVLPRPDGRVGGGKCARPAARPAPGLYGGNAAGG